MITPYTADVLSEEESPQYHRKYREWNSYRQGKNGETNA